MNVNYVQYLNRESLPRQYSPIMNNKSSRNCLEVTLPLRQETATPEPILLPIKTETIEIKKLPVVVSQGAQMQREVKGEVPLQDSRTFNRRTMECSVQTESWRLTPNAKPQSVYAQTSTTNLQNTNFGDTLRTRSIDMGSSSEGGYEDARRPTAGKNLTPNPSRRSQIYNEYTRGSISGSQVKMHQVPIPYKAPSIRSTRIFDEPQQARVSLTHGSQKVIRASPGYMASPAPRESGMLVNSNPNPPIYYGSRPSANVNNTAIYRTLREEMDIRPQPEAAKPKLEIQTLNLSIPNNKRSVAPSPDTLQSDKLLSPQFRPAAVKASAAPLNEDRSKEILQAAFDNSKNQTQAGASNQPSARYVEITKALEALNAQLMKGQATAAKLAELEDLMKEQRMELQKVNKLQEDWKSIKYTVDQMPVGTARSVQQATPADVGPSYSANDWVNMFKTVADTDPKFENYRQKIEVQPIITRDSNTRPDGIQVVVEAPTDLNMVDHYEQSFFRDDGNFAHGQAQVYAQTQPQPQPQVYNSNSSARLVSAAPNGPGFFSFTGPRTEQAFSQNGFRVSGSGAGAGQPQIYRSSRVYQEANDDRNSLFKESLYQPGSMNNIQGGYNYQVQTRTLTQQSSNNFFI